MANLVKYSTNVRSNRKTRPESKLRPSESEESQTLNLDIGLRVKQGRDKG